MTLQPGTALGPYQIDAPLGEGGMGEVYKATDTHLKRTVDIKVQPSGDLERSLTAVEVPKITVQRGRELPD